jgi:hypothetical protein
MARIVLVIVLALSAMGEGTVYAAQNSLPGDALYPVKLGTEQIIMMLPGDDVVRAERALSSAEQRVEEMEALAENGRPQDLGLAVEKYGYALNMTLVGIEQAGNSGLATKNITALVAEATTKHLYVLDTVYDKVPPQAKEAIAHARNVSETGYFYALAALAKNDTIIAAEMNLAAMEGRLNRVRAKLQDPEALQIALQQFYYMAGFVQKISQIAEETDVDVAEVAELVTNVTSRHLEVLAELYEEVPEEAKEAVKWAMEESFRGYEDITKVLIRSGAGESELPAIPESIRQRMEDILGWTDAPKAGMPTGGPPGWSCPSCGH